MASHGSGFLALVNEARTRVRECSVADVHARRARGEVFHLVDVREDREAAMGIAAGAIHLGRGVLERDVEVHVPDRAAPIVLYCGGGYRSVLAADSLQRMGYRDVSSMAGGWRAWLQAGLPVAQPR